ncbi:MAG: site-specific integrase [Nocardioides sp.]|uniref:tyrosine-type recombinase/integrase n=1 Tax=Nocardioides sp. TaxID=35761 RepID=UPI0039E6FAA6
MAWILKRERADGGVSATVVWRLGGGRSGAYQSETFAAGSDAQNLSRAEGFKELVDAAGQRWPNGWVKGYGFVRPLDWPTRTGNRSEELRFSEVGDAHLGHLVALTARQRQRYLSQLGVLARTKVGGGYLFARPITQISSADLEAWLAGWDRSVKTKEEYFGLVREVFAYAAKHQHVEVDPTAELTLNASRVRRAAAGSPTKMRVLTRGEMARAIDLAGTHGDLLAVEVATGLRFSEITALWAGDVDVAERTIRVTKAWKRSGKHDHAGGLEVSGRLARQIQAKHAMRGHYLFAPTNPSASRTVTVSPTVAEMLAKRVHGKADDPFVFTTRRGLPWHPDDFSNYVWTKLMTKLGTEGITRFLFDDLRHTHAAWLLASGVQLHDLQTRLGHESITTTIETYGHLLPAADSLISEIIETALASVDR